MSDAAPDPADWRCSNFARAQGLDPVGSAGTYDCFFLVETPLPWPRDVADVPELAAAMEAIAVAAPSTSVRVLMVGGDASTRAGARVVTQWCRPTSGLAAAYEGADHHVAPTELAATLAALAIDPSSRPADAPALRDVLVCTHGRRDVCCGGAGTRLFTEVRDRWPGVRVRRTSHTGGHRFAPTSFTFPEARAWAYLDAELLDRIVERRGDAGDLAGHYRGWAALDAPAQVAERELFTHIGWPWLDAEVAADPLAGVDPDSGTSGVALRWSLDGANGTATAGIGIRRRVPTLACGSPPDEATKADPEYEVRTFQRS